jgi:hypothetical protein
LVPGGSSVFGFMQLFSRAFIRAVQTNHQEKDARCPLTFPTQGEVQGSRAVPSGRPCQPDRGSRYIEVRQYVLHLPATIPTVEGHDHQRTTVPVADLVVVSPGPHLVTESQRLSSHALRRRGHQLTDRRERSPGVSILHDACRPADCGKAGSPARRCITVVMQPNDGCVTVPHTDPFIPPHRSMRIR